MRFYTRLKTTTSRWPSSNKNMGTEFVMPTMK
jgi:malonate-semialdehyde dehydrogenase (acetylating) / methylmalonate-semialdehyde dehydrogenase